MISYREEIKSLIDNCKQFWPTNKVDEVSHKEIQSVYKIIRFILRFHRLNAIFLLTVVYPIDLKFFRNQPFPTDFWQPYDLMITPRYEIVYAILYVMNVFVVVMISSVNSLYAAFMTYTIYQFKLCGLVFRNIKFEDIKTKVDEEKCWNEMKNCIKHHNYLIR